MDCGGAPERARGQATPSFLPDPRGLPSARCHTADPRIFLYHYCQLWLQLLASDHYQKVVRLNQSGRDDDLGASLLRRLDIDTNHGVVIGQDPRAALAYRSPNDSSRHRSVIERRSAGSDCSRGVYVLSRSYRNLWLSARLLVLADELSDRDCGCGVDWID